MRIFYLNPLMSTLLQENNVSVFANSIPDIGTLLIYLFFSEYATPFERIVLGFLLFLEACVLLKHDNRLLSFPKHDGKEETFMEGHPNILLIMKDTLFSTYLQTALSGEFNTTFRETLDMPELTSAREKPDAIIIDETVDGMCGDELCLCIRDEETTADIPLVLLVTSNDNRSYHSHAGSGADRLELRTASIYRLKTDLYMLIDRYMFLRKRVNRKLAEKMHMLSKTVEKDDTSLFFISKVRELLGDNLATEGYTIDTLCADMGMSRTNFYNRMKDLTGKPPVEYMLCFKMEKAKLLLASGRYSITEISEMLGYCDAKYFGKRFKSFYHVCPTRYLKEAKESENPDI